MADSQEISPTERSARYSRREVLRRGLALSLGVSAASLLAACGGEQDYPTTQSNERHLGRPVTDAERAKSGGGLFGPGGITLLGSSGRDQERNRGGGDGIGVNSFIWRGALDTIAFMPLVPLASRGGRGTLTHTSQPRTSRAATPRS